MPAPTDPYRQQAIEAIATKLRAINGNPLYFNTVKSTSVATDPVVNPLTAPPTEAPYFWVEPTDLGSRLYMPAMRLKNNFQVVVTAVNYAVGPAHTRSKMETWEQLIADIEVALTRDITLGGIAVDVRLLEPTPGFDLGASPIITVLQPVVVNLIRSYGQP